MKGSSQEKAKIFFSSNIHSLQGFLRMAPEHHGNAPVTAAVFAWKAAAAMPAGAAGGRRRAVLGGGREERPRPLSAALDVAAELRKLTEAAAQV